jgi:adenine deaminase
MKNQMKLIEGNIVDVVNKTTFKGIISVVNGKITKIETIDNKCSVDEFFILPGLIDAHIHIESSMLSPSEFSKIAVRHGTVATVSDPHEIANVMGIEGVNYMIRNGKQVPFKFYFGAPSCVPATDFETSGAVLNSEEIEILINDNGIKYLSEMMNFPGVIYDDVEVWKKINVAKKYQIPIDGHAPGLAGDKLIKYASAGITTDHESFTLDEAVEKIKLGIKLQIREGSAAKNFDALYKAIDLYPDDIMLCSDDLHPDELMSGHINKLVARALSKGLNTYNVLRAATFNPVRHYNLNVGMLQVGDPADFIVVDSLPKMNVLQTYIDGELVFDKGKCLIETIKTEVINKFDCNYITENDIQIENINKKINVIQAIDDELITKKIVVSPKIKNNLLVPDFENDILKIIVLNRYQRNTKPTVGFINGFNLKSGAFASSIAHDSHNIIAVGTSDFEIVKAVNRLIELKGGIVLSDNDKIFDLQLNIGGIMSDKSGIEVADKYKFLNQKAKELGCKLKAPFMTLSFMALLVIPDFKIGDKCLFDVTQFKPISLFV